LHFPTTYQLTGLFKYNADLPATALELGKAFRKYV
jgi:hypothetical protein